MQRYMNKKSKDTRFSDKNKKGYGGEALCRILKKDPTDRQAFSLMTNQYLKDRDFKKALELAYRYLDKEFNLEVANLLVNCLINLKEFHLARLIIRYIIENIGADNASCKNLEKIEKRLSLVNSKKTSKKFRFIKNLMDRAIPSVSLCMIVKDEEKNLARCLESAKPVVSEIIIVDTGSSDGTRDIAGEYGARVIEYKWEDDFAKARNRSIKHATSDFVLFLDADEVLDESSYPFFYNLKKPKDPCSYFVKIINLTDKDNVESSAEHFSTRLWTNHTSFKFSGRVHEVLIFTDKALMHKRLISGITITHHGYMQDFMKQRNKFDRNLKLLKSAIKDEPSNPFHEYNLGVHYQAMGKTEKALEHFSIMQKKLNGRKTSYLPFALSYASAAYNDIGSYEKAIDSARKALVLNNDLKDAYFNIARAQMKKENYEEAIKNFQKILKADDNVLIGGTIDTGTRSWKTINGMGICYIALGKNKKALECFEKAYKSKKDSAVILGNLMTTYYKTGQKQKIKGLLKEASENLNSIEQIEMLSNKLRGIGEHEIALSFLSDIESIYKKSAEKKHSFGDSIKRINKIRAGLHFADKDYQKASKCYKDCFKDGLMDPLSLENWGIANLNLGDYKKAEDIFKRLLSKNSSWSVYHNLGTASMFLEDIDQAFKYLIKAESLNPGNVETLMNLGKICLFKKDYISAEARLQEAVDADDKNIYPEIKYFLSQAKYFQQKYDQVSEILAIYLEDVKDPRGYDLLGMCLYKMKKYDEAVLCFSEAIEIDNTRAEYFNNLGNSLARLGNIKDSKNAYHCALLLEPGNKRAEAGMQSLFLKESLSNLS